MIPIETLKRVAVVYSHANCPDGLASAMILKDAFRMLGTSPRIEFLAHGTPEHRQAGLVGRALFCDIAPTAGVADMTTVGPHVVLDHHIGAKDIVLSFNERANGDVGVFADEKLEPGVSGAVLAFREVWEPCAREVENPAPDVFRGGFSLPRDDVSWFAHSVGARDTWNTEDPRFQRGQWISKLLMSKPASYWLGDDVIEPGNAGILPHAPYLSDSEIQIGRALFEAHEEAVRQAVGQCVHSFVEDGGGAATGTGFGDVKTGVELYTFQEQASGFRLTSDVAEAIRSSIEEQGGTEHGVIAGFSYVVDKPGGAPRLLFSLRGLGGFDVATFAKANGGGGHTAAAGFSVPGDEVEMRGPYAHIRIALHEFLHGRS